MHRDWPYEPSSKVALAGCRICTCNSVLSSPAFEMSSYAIGGPLGHPCIAFRRLVLYARGYLS
jgi:hypothetical protein